MGSRSELITSVCAIIVAICALCVSFYEADVTREYQEISVWPHLTFYNKGNAEVNGKPFSFAYYIRNDGIGPAIIKKIEYIYKGKDYERLVEVVKDILPNYDGGFRYSDKQVISVILPDKEHMLIGGFTNKEQTRKFFAAARDSIDIRVCYCSLYNQCWLMGEGVEKKEIKNCSK